MTWVLTRPTEVAVTAGADKRDVQVTTLEGKNVSGGIFRYEEDTPESEREIIFTFPQESSNELDVLHALAIKYEDDKHMVGQAIYHVIKAVLRLDRD